MTKSPQHGVMTDSGVVVHMDVRAKHRAGRDERAGEYHAARAEGGTD